MAKLDSLANNRRRQSNAGSLVEVESAKVGLTPRDSDGEEGQMKCGHLPGGALGSKCPFLSLPLMSGTYWEELAKPLEILGTLVFC